MNAILLVILAATLQCLGKWGRCQAHIADGSEKPGTASSGRTRILWRGSWACHLAAFGLLLAAALTFV